MYASMKTRWLSEHRGWEDYLSAGLGVLIILSPMIVDGVATAAAMGNAGFFGVLIVALAMLELMSLRRWEEILELLCGAWLIVSPLVFQYDGALRMSHVVLGAAVAVLAVLELWQDRRRKLVA